MRRSRKSSQTLSIRIVNRLLYDDLDLNNALVVVIIKNQVEKFWVLHNQFGTILNLNIVNLEVRCAIFGNSNERTFPSILNEEFGLDERFTLSIFS